MMYAQRRNPGIVHLGSSDTSVLEEPTKNSPVSGGLRERRQAGRLEPGIDLFQGQRKRRGRTVDSGMGHDSQKLVEARPGDRPGGRCAGQPADASERGLVPRRVLAMGVHEEVGVDGCQFARSS